MRTERSKLPRLWNRSKPECVQRCRLLWVVQKTYKYPWVGARMRIVRIERFSFAGPSDMKRIVALLMVSFVSLSGIGIARRGRLSL